MAKKSNKAVRVELNAAETDALEQAMLLAEIAPETAAPTEPVDIAQATAEANGASAALQAEAEAPVVLEAADEAPIQAEAGSFLDLIANVSNSAAEVMNADLVAAFAERAAYEVEKNPANNNIQKTLTKLTNTIRTPNVMRGLIVAGLTSGVVNKSETSNARRNVYALEKLRDILYGAVTGHPVNAINKAVLVSLVKLQDVGLPFTGLAAKAAASDKVAIDNAYKAHMSRHTVSESTASTQSSSTMTALEDLGVVVNKGTQKMPVWSLTDTPLAQRLVEVTRTKLFPIAV